MHCKPAGRVKQVPLSYLGRSNIENVCNLYRIVGTIETGQVHHLLRLFVQQDANTDNIPRSHRGIDPSGPQVLMAQEFLNLPDVITIFQ